MRHIDRVTAQLRQWLRDWDRLGGDPDHPYAMHVKDQVALAESSEAEHRARLDAHGLLEKADAADARLHRMLYGDSNTERSH